MCSALTNRTYHRVAALAVAVLSTLMLVGCGGAKNSPEIGGQGASATATAEASSAPAPAVIATVTVTDGSLLERDIVPQLANAFSLSDDDVKAVLATAESGLIGSRTSGFRRMEGMVPPGSYEVLEGSTLDELVRAWISRSEHRYHDVMSTVAEPNGLSAPERLALASVVEAECLAGEQRGEVAATFLNRLRDGQRLQSCVTAEYAVGYQRPFLLNKDVAKKSAYNTYQASGLPEGPICAVSDASLAAASGRSADPDVYYFFYDYVRGKIYFFSDYTKFRKAAAESRERFEQSSPVGAHDKIDKQRLYGAAARQK